MKSLNRLVYLAFATFLAMPAISANAKLEFEANQLMLRNSEQVMQILVKKIKAAQKLIAKSTEGEAGVDTDPEAKKLLIDALRVVLSRPDQDGARNSLFAKVRRELNDLGELEASLNELAKEAIDDIKQSKGSTKAQATYVVVLENLMAEIKPEIGDNESLKQTIAMIRDADIKLSPEVKKQSFIRSMSRLRSPSETAATIAPKNKK